MYQLSDHCPRREGAVQGGKGLIHMKDLATKEQMYDHARLFSQITVNPGCSIGYHAHKDETEFYYILKGEAVFNDNGTEVTVHAGDVTATGYGESHSLENRTDEPVELVALIVLK
ncbi:MAG: cupin domain-containing protein [Oscillibacter sp.]|jgi:mannose-6-phosphate isomerase-like protein (cupin superfamily)|nr:cupin domain-containing protein [Oscillibacter sp.]